MSLLSGRVPWSRNRSVGLPLAMLSAVVFSKHYLFPGIAIGDFILAGVTAFCAIKVCFYRKVSAEEFFVLYGLILVSVCSVFWGLVERPFSIFSMNEFLKSFAKLIFFVFFMLTVRAYLKSTELSTIDAAVRVALVSNALIALYVILAANVGLPFEFLWIGQDDPTPATMYFHGNQTLIRMRGMFPEPSLFSIFQALGLAFLIFKSQVRITSMVSVFVILSILLSFSMSGYVLLAAILGATFLRNFGFRFSLQRAAMVVVAICLLSVALWPFREAFTEAVVQRAIAMSSGQDDSTLFRLIVSWELPLVIISESPLFGAGLGQMGLLFPVLRSDMPHGSLARLDVLGAAESWNMFAYILGSLGLVGFFLVLFMLLKVAWKDKALLALFVGAGFGSGNFLSPWFWVFFALFFYPEKFVSSEESSVA